MVAREDLGALSAGPHVIRLAERMAVAPGMYWLRLTHDVHTLTKRGIVLR
jgi:hypothetical protein